MSSNCFFCSGCGCPIPYGTDVGDIMKHTLSRCKIPIPDEFGIYEDGE